MVYNDSVYRPATLGERLQAKFSERAAAAVFRASSNRHKAAAENGQSEVLSFFGRIDDTRTADRAMPSKRRAAQRQARPAQKQESAQSRAAQRQTGSAQTQTAQKRGSAQSRTAQRQTGSTQTRTAQTQTRTNTARTANAENTGSFARAYAAGANVRRAAENYRIRYANGTAPSGAGRKGRTGNTAAGRSAANNRTAAKKTDAKNRSRTASGISARNQRIAEHRLKSSPFPMGFVTLICICAFMVMVLVYSFSQIHEYGQNISELKTDISVLDRQASRLELEIAEKDNLQEIERIAVDEIGMVSNERVESEYLNIAPSEKAQILRNDSAEEKSGFAALLSVISETFEGLGDYFG